MKAVLSIFSPIIRISPPLSQMCPNMERDIRKGHRTSLSCWDMRRFAVMLLVSENSSEEDTFSYQL